GVSPSIRRPSNQTSPELGWMCCVTALNAVVLPAPFGPMMLWMLPGMIARSRPDSATSPPQRMVTARQSRSGPGVSVGISVVLRRDGIGAGIEGERRVGIMQFALPHRRGPESLGAQLHHHD